MAEQGHAAAGPWLPRDGGAYNINTSEAYGINDFTHVVGQGTIGLLVRGFPWRAGTMIDLGALSGQVVSQAAAINNSGLIAGKKQLLSGHLAV